MIQLAAMKFGNSNVIQLKPIIDVREIPPCASRSRQGLPSVRTLVRESAAPDEGTILNYLRQGVTCGVFNDPRLIYDVHRLAFDLDTPIE